MSSSKKFGEPVVLKRQLGLWSCIAMTISPIIGSGIFISPKGILQSLDGSVGLSLIMWLLCGTFSIIGALSFAELSTMMKKSGGYFIYVLEAYSELFAFLIVFVFIFATRPAANAIITLTMSRYLLSPFFSSEDCPMPDSAIALVAVIVFTLITILNVYSVKWSYRSEIVFTSMKVLGLIMIIFIGMSRLIQGYTSSFENPFDGNPRFGNIALAYYSGMWAYSGWQLMPVFIEEIENPGRNIPIAIGTSLSIVTVIYMLTNVAYLTVLSPEQLLASPAVASDFAIITLGDWAWIVQVLVGLSCLSSRITSTFGAARLTFSSAREGLNPKILAMISIRWLTPLPAILLSYVLCCLMMPIDDIYALLNYLSFIGWFINALSISIVPYYRWKYPDLERPYKCPIIFPIIFVILSIIIQSLAIYSAPKNCAIGAAMLLIGVAVYYVFIYWKSKPTWFDNALIRTTHFLQKLMMVVYQEEASY